MVDDTIEVMKARGFKTEISITWCADDVLSLDETLTAEQVNDVLSYLEHKHDASIGINWDVIGIIIDNIKGA